MARIAADTTEEYDNLRRILMPYMDREGVPPREPDMDQAEYDRLIEMFMMMRAIDALPKPTKIELSRRCRTMLAAVHISAEAWSILVGSDIINGENVVSNGMVTVSHEQIRYPPFFYPLISILTHLLDTVGSSTMLTPRSRRPPRRRGPPRGAGTARVLRASFWTFLTSAS